MRRSLSSPLSYFCTRKFHHPHPDCFSFSKNCTIENPPSPSLHDCELKYGPVKNTLKQVCDKHCMSVELTFLHLKSKDMLIIQLYLPYKLVLYFKAEVGDLTSNLYSAVDLIKAKSSEFFLTLVLQIVLVQPRNSQRDSHATSQHSLVTFLRWWPLLTPSSFLSSPHWTILMSNFCPRKTLQTDQRSTHPLHFARWQYCG